VWADSCEELLARGEQAFEERRLPDAASLFRSATGVCRPDAQLFVTLGQVQYLLAREADAEQALKTALELRPGHEGALYALGRIYYQQHRYPEAERLLLAVVKKDAKNHRAWDNLGLCYDAMNRDSDALRSFFRALDLVMKSHPDYDWAHANLADFFLKRNENEKAFQLAAEAARRNPQSARNALLTGKALVKLDKHELALRWLERATELDPNESSGWYQLSLVYRKLGRRAEAAAALKRFQEANAKQPVQR
jgi:tetratricopeptide (TPR) repeat protein